MGTGAVVELACPKGLRLFSPGEGEKQAKGGKRVRDERFSAYVKKYLTAEEKGV